MRTASIPVVVLTDIEGDPEGVLLGMFPGKPEFVIVQIASQYDLYVTQGEEDPQLLASDLGQYFYVPDVLSPPREATIPQEFALEILSTAIRASK